MTTTPATTTDESGNYEPESTYRAGDVPTRVFTAPAPRRLSRIEFEAAMGNTARGQR
jgi:hypothetical protein